MTVQLPVLLWTVICFCLLMVILDRLLFRPMLAFMDQRQERIDRAMQKKAEYDRALAEANQRLEKFREEEETHLAGLVGEEIARAKKDAETLRTVTYRKQVQTIDLYLAEFDAEAKQLEERMDESTEKLAEAYLSTLISR